MKKIREIEGVIIREGDGHDVRVGDLVAFLHDADEGGFWADVPVLPGCFTQGETIDEVVANLDDAIRGWLESQGVEELKALGVPFSFVLKGEAEAPAPHRLIRSLEFAA